MNISIAPPRRVGDPGAPRLRADVLGALSVAWGAAIATAVLSHGRWADLAVLGATLVGAELLEMQLTDGTSLPLSPALLLPVAVAGDPGPIALTVAFAAVLVTPTRRPVSFAAVAGTVAARLAAALAAWASYRAVTALAPADRPASVLGSLVVAATAVLIVELGVRRVRREESFAAAGGYSAFFAVAASGLLTAVGYAGVDGRGAMGLWSVPMFAVPALSARWAFGRLHAIRRTYDQTIHVLSAVPEMGGRVRPGHSRRVADLSLDVGRMLGLPRRALADLERAALLHALGSVTFDEADLAPVPPPPRELAGATVGVLGDEEHLSRPAGLVAKMAGEPVDLHEEDALAAEVLKMAAAYETVAGGDPSRARMAFEVASVPGGGDRRVVLALARVVTHRTLTGRRA